jgi:hypothetical protein
MVKTTIYLTEEEQEVINAVKRKYNLKTNRQALSVILKWYDKRTLEMQSNADAAVKTEKKDL